MFTACKNLCGLGFTEDWPHRRCVSVCKGRKCAVTLRFKWMCALLCVCVCVCVLVRLPMFKRPSEFFLSSALIAKQTDRRIRYSDGEPNSQ